MRRVGLLAVAGLLAASTACGDGRDLVLPAQEELEGLYGGSVEVGLNGNVVDVRARQPMSHLQRGGDLWAKVGPYIYLFSPQTQELFAAYAGVAAVRVRTVGPGSAWIAEAMLRRDTLTSLTWREARRRVARARTEGTENPGHLEDLVRFGEDYTSYEYNPRWVKP